MRKAIIAAVTVTLLAATPALACDLEMMGGMHRFNPLAAMYAQEGAALPMNSQEQAAADKARADAFAREKAPQSDPVVAANSKPAAVPVVFRNPAK